MRRTDHHRFPVARSETARDINRRIVLNLIRRNQPISRASLARRSGLQRSTVSAIAGQLISERLVAEGAVGQVPRGRKPTFLQLNPERCGIIGVDIRAGTTLIGVAGLDSRLVAQETITTAGMPEEFLARLGRRIRDLQRAHPRSSYEGIGVSLPGRIDPTTQRLLFAPSLGWGEVDIKSVLESATGLPVEMENSANACALAELWSGRHGESVRNLVTLGVSDGIGVGMIVNGQLVRGVRGLAGEFGHVSLDENGLPCRCGNRGCLETLASNAAAVRYYAEVTSVRRGEVGSKSAMARLTFEDLLRLVEQGDERAGQALDRMAHFLGRGVAMLVTGLAPEVLVVVGEITRVWDRVGPAVSEVVQRQALKSAATRLLITRPEAQPRLGGTIALVLQKHFGHAFNS
jgi:predicted NBD/HSP70 family sugar kinase